MLSQPTIIGLSIGAALLLVIMFVFTGGFATLLVLLALGAIVIYTLNVYGVFKVTTDSNNKLNVNIFETPPAPKTVDTSTSNAPSLGTKEVFYIAGNNYTYNEAPALCAAYEAELASYDNVLEAYNKGAEWCGYGWTAGGMALYPTQKATWDKLQGEVDISKRTSCGRVGINGGYFDPNTRIGDNCYGTKPGDTGIFKYPVPLPTTNPEQFNKMVNSFKSMIDKFVVLPFNRNSWSEFNIM